ncbi:MAG: ATP synthase F0 subunit C [Pseudobacteriovorax sp.]|nr:ATP synthase F0 subunit C [Pseudobacteriovorax sp.]
MKRNFGKFLVVLSGLLFSSMAFAAEGGDTSGWMAIGSSLAIGLAALGGTFSQGRAADAALSGIARNPTSADKVFTPMIIALALIEFQAIMGFIIAFLWYAK